MKKYSVILIVLIIVMQFALVSCGGGYTVDYQDVPDTLINPNASEAATALYHLLKEVYGSNILTGQYVNVFESPEKYGEDIFAIAEMEAVYGVTGKYPAVLGLDATRFEDLRAEHVLELAKDWYNAGGIITMCWHWFSPDGEEGRGNFYTKEAKFNLKKALADKDSIGYQRLISDINNTAFMLRELNDLDIPIIWRPLHEASGRWFWWGASGKEAYFELYRLIYDIFTNEYELNNLIWAWNGQSSSWYVGDEYCDIIGEDTYPSNLSYRLNPSMSNKFDRAYKTTPNKKMIAMSENGVLPDLQDMFSKGKVWLFNAVWSYEFVCLRDENGSFIGEYSEEYVSKEYLYAFYDDSRTITLDQLSNVSGKLVLN